MDEDYGQRRRVAIALAITVILGPAAFLLNRSRDDGAENPPSTLVGQVVIAGEEPETDEAGRVEALPVVTDPMGTTPPEIVVGTVPDQANDPPTIAIPRPAPAIRGTASFSREIDDPTACQVRDLVSIPFASEIVVTNLNNSQSVRCVVTVTGVAEHDVVLNADAFLQIGDLTDTPLAVELSW